MTPELTVLALAGVLHIAHLALFSITANVQVGMKQTMGPRDGGLGLTGIAGRAQRAEQNHIDGLTLFAVAVIVVTLGEATSPLTAICAWVYLASRIAYIPVYAFGVPLIRSVVWGAGYLATMLMLVTALL